VLGLLAKLWIFDAVQWTAPASCPDDAAVEARIAAYVDVEANVSPTIATVVERADGFEVELVSTIDGETQRRTLAAPTCETLADAAAAVIAVTIDPLATEPAAQEIPPPEVAPDVAVQPPAINTTRGMTPEPAIEDESRRPLEIGLRTGGGYGSAIAPRGSGVLGVAVSIGRRPWTIEAEARLWTPRTFEAADESFGARVIMGTAMLVGCLRPPSQRVEVPLCLGVEAGRQNVAPRELDAPVTRGYPWVAPLVRAGLRFRLNDLMGLVLTGEAAVPVVRAAIQIEGFGELWQTQAVSGRALVAIDFRWIR
jgi:hypothetical protein